MGWEARGTIWQAWRSAAKTGGGLVDLIGRIRHVRKTAIDILCHSLGARVVLSAAPGLPLNSLGRVILLTAAEFQNPANRALASPAGQTAEFINVMSRENDLYDACVEWLIRPGRPKDRMLGAGIWNQRHNWLDMQVDCPRSRNALREFGHFIAPPQSRICHWSSYLRPGLMEFYRDLIRNPRALPLEALRQSLPQRVSPRWSRLRPVLPKGLPMGWTRPVH